MAVLARASITLVQTVDVSSVTWYYKLQASTATKPSKPTTLTPSGWTTEEPSYTEGSTNSLYVCVRTVYSDGTFDYSDVSLSTSYEAAKVAYNKSASAEGLATAAQSSADGKNTNFYNLKYDDPVGIKEGDTWFVQEWEDKEYDPETETWVSPNWFEKLMPNDMLPYTKTWDDPAIPTTYGTSATISKNQDGTYTISGTMASGNRYFAYNLAKMGTFETNTELMDGRAYLPNGTYHFVLNGTNKNIRVGLFRYVIPHSSTGATAQATKTTTGDVTITVNLKDYPYNAVTIYLTKDVDINGTIAPTITRTDDRLITTAVKKWAIVNNQGTWVDAALADGAFARIDAGNIVTGSLDANRIQTGVLRTVRLEGPDMQTYWRLDTGAWQNHGIFNPETYDDEGNEVTWDVDVNVNIKDGLYTVNGTHENTWDYSSSVPTKETQYVNFGVSADNIAKPSMQDYNENAVEPYAYSALNLRGDRYRTFGEDNEGLEQPCYVTPEAHMTPDALILGDSIKPCGEWEYIPFDAEDPDAHYTPDYAPARNRLVLNAGDFSTVLSSISYDEYFSIVSNNGVLERKYNSIPKTYYVPWARDISTQLDVVYDGNTARCSVTGTVIVQGKTCTVDLLITQAVSRAKSYTAYQYVKLDEPSVMNPDPFLVAPVNGYAALNGYFESGSNKYPILAYVERVSGRNYTDICLVAFEYAFNSNAVARVTGTYVIDRLDIGTADW